MGLKSVLEGLVREGDLTVTLPGGARLKLGDGSGPPPAGFSDVSSTHPFADEIQWMADQGITTGHPASPKPLYKPAAAVSRDAMSAFMFRLAGEPAFSPPGSATFARWNAAPRAGSAPRERQRSHDWQSGMSC